MVRGFDAQQMSFINATVLKNEFIALFLLVIGTTAFWRESSSKSSPG